MKKLFFIFAMLFAVISANAQYNVSGHKFFDNWSVGTDGGITTNLHDWDTPNGGVWGIQLTKGITPVVSFEFSTQLGFNNNSNWNVVRSANAVDNLIALGSVKVNLMNWFGGYKGTPRLFEINARGGFGYMHNFYPSNQNAFTNLQSISSGDYGTAVAKLGFDFDFNLGKSKAWTISARPAVILRGQKGISGCDNMPKCNAYSHNAVGQLTIGVTYHFKTSNKKHHFTTIAPITVTDTIEKIVEVEKVVIQTVEAPKTDAMATVEVGCVTIPFAFNSTILTDDGKAILNTLTTSNVIVKGYSSFEPKSNKVYNKKLSQRRADVVANYLKEKGVNVISSDGFGDEIDGRMVIVSVDK